MYSFPEKLFDWKTSVFGKVSELFPEDVHVPLGKPAVAINYYDANFHYSVLTGRLVTGVLHLLNKTPIDWCSKKQATV